MSQARKTMRIQYGRGKYKLYWTVKITDAKKDVEVNGSLMDALRGTPGETIGCHLSNCAVRNAHLFPHDCVLAAFNKTTCMVVDKVSNGAPSHAYRYMHSYGQLVDLNDIDKEKTKIKNNPSLAERTFILRAPKGNDRRGTRPTLPYTSVEERKRRGWNKLTGEKAHVVPRGALARARKAGLVTADLANALNCND